MVGRHRDVLELIEHDGLVSATQIGPVRCVEAGRLREILFRDVEAHVAPVVAKPPHAPQDNTVYAAHTKDASVMDDGLLNAVVPRITHEVVLGGAWCAISVLVPDAFPDLRRKTNLLDLSLLQYFGEIRENVFDDDWLST